MMIITFKMIAQFAWSTIINMMKSSYYLVTEDTISIVNVLKNGLNFTIDVQYAIRMCLVRI